MLEPAVHNKLKSLNFRDPAVWLATWFGCGLMKPAPGTWGTLGALPFGVMMLVFGGWPVLLAGIIFISWAGRRAADRMEKQMGEHDAGIIVVDEVAGMWLTLLAAKPAALSVALAFLLFRFFDIVKPWPVSWCDRKLEGATGVMADDLAAGVYAALCLLGLHYAGFG